MDREPLNAGIRRQSSAAAATILVVDDDDDVRVITADILALRGHAVLTAASGAEALTICSRHGGPIDLLLTDVEMPRMRGPDVAWAVRSIRPEARVLFMSGTASTSGLEAPLLPKPFTMSALLGRVGALLGSAPPERALQSSA
jgi:two-component system cell cycle sensor histidine kinase/response regulator CckA